jgi:hypothetical protein
MPPTLGVGFAVSHVGHGGASVYRVSYEGWADLPSGDVLSYSNGALQIVNATAI